MNTLDEQVATLMQGTDYGDPHLREAMELELRARLEEAEKSKRSLRVYCGFDPRTADLHIGHTVPMRKLRQFQEYGHEVTFLIGTYTSLIGDPSDKDQLRPQLSSKAVEDNARTYAEQAMRILDPERTVIRYNAEWLQKLDFADLINLSSHFTIQQFLTRDNFRKRWEKGDAIYLHETFYSIMQAYDAYTLDADVQVGGTDQLFNIVTAGRKLMTALGAKPNVGIIVGILPGTDGEIKMSKSLGNHIPLNSTPEDMFGKVMSVPDEAMPDYMRLVTRWTAAKVEEMIHITQSGELHPRDAKMQIAREITGAYYGNESAREAQEAFVQVFQKGGVPEDMPEHMLTGDESVLDVLVANQLVSSNSEGKRIVKQKGVRLDGQTLHDALAAFPGPGVLQVGKRKFLRVLDA